MENIVERAKETTANAKRRNFVITQDVIELALAWAKDEVTIAQCERVLSVKEHNKIYAILARALKASNKDPNIPKKLVKKTEPIINMGGNLKETPLKLKPIGKTPDMAPNKY